MVTTPIPRRSPSGRIDFRPSGVGRGGDHEELTFDRENAGLGWVCGGDNVCATSYTPNAVAEYDDGNLLERLRAGDEGAYEILVRSDGPRLLAVARRILRDDDEAQEVVQETFVQAFEKLDSFEGRSKLSTWLHRIAVNFSLQRLRKRGRDTLARSEPFVESLQPEFDQWGCRVGPHTAILSNPEREVVARQELRDVVEALDALPEAYRALLVLADVEGLSGPEIAEIEGVAHGTVRVRLHRARSALRALVARKRDRGRG